MLIADRFLVREAAAPTMARDGAELYTACDLASGESMTVSCSTVGGGDRESRWLARCDGWATLHHPRVARLVDYGPVDARSTFEAWRAVIPWRGRVREARVSRVVYDGFAAGEGLSTTPADPAGEWRGHCVIVPGTTSGYLVGVGSAGSRVPESSASDMTYALDTIAQPAVDAVAELLMDAARREPCAVALWGPPGSGVGVATRAIARLARVHGMVPVDVSMLDEGLRRVLGDRSLVLIDRSCRGSGRRGWRSLLDAGVRHARGHLLVVASTHEVPGMANVRVEPVSAEALVAAVRPRTRAGLQEAWIERVAARSGGLPGRFVAALNRRPPVASYELSGRATGWAAEPVSPYRTSSADRPPASRLWPVSGETGLLRARLDGAVQELRSGRHIRAERMARGTAGALARRGDFDGATRGWLAIARARLRRGQVAAAKTALEEARRSAQRADDEAALVDVAVVSGAAAVDAGALADAETVLRGAVATARAFGQSERLCDARGALSRVLFWQGRYDEAAEHVRVEGENPPADREAVILCAAAARAAVGVRASDAGIAAAARALAAAERTGEPHLLAHARCVAAFVHLTVDDRAAVARDVERCVAAARAAHDPLRALRARLMAAEVERREGRADRARRLLTHVQALKPEAVPASIQVRIRLLRALLDDGDDPDAPTRIGAATGFAAVTLFAERPRDLPRSPTSVAEVLELIAGTQQAADEHAAMSAVCSGLRGRLRAAAVAFLVADGDRLTTVAAAGTRLDAVLAARVMAAGQPVRVHAVAGGATAGVPVRVGGRILGSLVARWSPGVDVPAERSDSLLTLAAAVAAPALAAVRVRAAPPSSAPDEILGTSAAIEIVRQAVIRAAPAPYPVLIEGESGCGKELVARAVHRRSPRRERACCAVNCAALPDELLEAELFGHARGAFTGAVTERAGVFEEAHGGTLFLDEVGELSPRAQAKLLRTIQEGEVRRLGENGARRVDVRIVAATNRDLREEAGAGRFRFDLLYRLDVIRIAVPPLRERPDDIVLLAEHFWRDATTRVRSRAVLSADTLAALSRYPWPGNVRELQNAIAALAVAAPARGIVWPCALPRAIGGIAAARGGSLVDARRAFDVQFVRSALARAGGHRAKAAGDLGLSRQGLTKLMCRLGIAEPEPGGDVDADTNDTDSDAPAEAAL